MQVYENKLKSYMNSGKYLGTKVPDDDDDFLSTALQGQFSGQAGSKTAQQQGLARPQTRELVVGSNTNKKISFTVLTEVCTPEKRF